MVSSIWLKILEAYIVTKLIPRAKTQKIWFLLVRKHVVYKGKGNQMQKMAEQFGLHSDFCLAYPDIILYFICCYTILYVILCHCMILCCDTDTC